MTVETKTPSKQKMQDKYSSIFCPEEKLLNLIRTQTPPANITPEEKFLDILRKPNIKNPLAAKVIPAASDKTETKKTEQSPKPESIKLPALAPVNTNQLHKNIIIAAFAFGVIIIGFSSLIIISSFRQPIKLSIPALTVKEEINNQNTDTAEKQTQTPKSTITYIASENNNRENTAERLDDLLKNISFVGAVYGKEPQIIIEDKIHSNVYYLREGESFKEIKIVKIKKGLVTIKYHGKTLSIPI